ncbi:sodium transporter HKT1-like [Arachis stenosperma]|uniref:sodium transporter HKT1-like n=1 Tax=Arachis stenosperma TaxID=217475 RepID=UPI0025AB98D9|nr:sodium transporter HKT1-like [Arachis stenosperma]
MMNFSLFGRKLQHLCSSLYFHLNFSSFFIQLCYFMILSLFGYLGLKISKTRTHIKPNDFDLFYTSVSSSTVSSMTAVEMEVFSNSQLILMTFLMFVGGEVFTSLLELIFTRFNNNKNCNNSSTSMKNSLPIKVVNDQIELGLVSIPNHHTSQDHKQINDVNGINNNNNNNVPSGTIVSYNNNKDMLLRSNSLKYLSHVVLGYFLVLQFVGTFLVSMYMSFIPSARQVLREKGIKTLTFSLFTIVSTFASCGYVPTNENMIVFKKNSGLLLIILPYILLGNTLYAPCLRFVIWVLEKITKREEFSYLLRNSKEIGYGHLLPALHSWLLVATVLGFNIIQFVIFCSMEWGTQIMDGLNPYQKFVASLFQITNARHSGESVFDLSTISSAILVLFVVMMYLPPYTTFLPIMDHETENDAKKDKRSLVECLVFSQLSYLVIFIILICITENKSLREDPLNFNVFNITIEVISAYGNVGFSMGYSCARQLKANGSCKDLWVGFSGKWSNKGKFILILVMFFGRLKKFNMKGGKAWDLS